MSELSAAIAKVIRKLRGEESLSQFARDCGVHRSCLSLLEGQKNLPRLEILMKIAHASSLSAAQLVEWIELEMKTARGSEPTGRESFGTDNKSAAYQPAASAGSSEPVSRCRPLAADGVQRITGA